VSEIEITGKSLEECLEKASTLAGLSKEEIKYELIQKGRKGFLGFFKKDYKIKVFFDKQEKVETQQKKEAELPKEEIEFSDLTDELKVDGFFKVDVREDGIYLAVFPPEGGGKPVNIHEVKKYLDEVEVVNANFGLVEIAVDEADGKPVKIAEYDTSVYHDAKLKVKILDKKMRATIEIIPPKPKCGKPITVELLRMELQKHKIVYGIDEAKLFDLAENPIYNKPIEIAHGLPPVDGEDAVINYSFTIKEKKLKPAELEDGRVDFHKLDFIVNVNKGEVLAEKIPPTPGTPGKNIFGETLKPKPGKDIKFVPGPNVKVSEDGLRIISEIDGQVIKEGNKVKVLPVLEIMSNVDYSTGDIDFIGTVIVNGNVLDDFKITAAGDIVIRKSVHGAILKAGRDIVINSGIIARDKGKLVAERDIRGKFVENAYLKAGNDVLITKAIMHSAVYAGKYVRVSDKKGLIVGGKIVAGKLIECHTIGSYMATKTELEVGISPETREKLVKVDEELSRQMKNLISLEKAIKLLKIKQNKNMLSEEKLKILKSSLEMYQKVKANIEELESQKAELEKQIEDAKGGEVRALTIIHPGVIVSIRKGVKHIKEPIKTAILVYEAGEIVTGVL